MTATLTVAAVATAIRTILTRDGDLTAKPATKDVLAHLGYKGSPEFYAMWGDVAATAIPWQEKASWVLANWQGQNRIPGRACRAADAAIAAGATTATAMKAPKGVDAIEHRLRVLRDLLGDKAPATVVGVGDSPAPQTAAPAPVQQPATPVMAAQAQAPTAAQTPAAPKPDAKVVQADVDRFGREMTAARQAAQNALAEAASQDEAAAKAQKAAAKAREGHREWTAKADALESQRAGLLTLLATLVNVPVPPAPAKPEPLSQSDNVLTCEPKVQPPVVVPPSVPVANPNVTASIGQKDAMRLGKDGLVKLAQQLVADGKLAGPIDTTSRGWMAKLASAVAKATQKPAADKSAATQAKPAALRLYVEDGKGGFRLASEQEIWAALDQMSKAAA